MYKTVSHTGSAEIAVKNSRFIGYVKCVSGKDEAEEFINEIKMKNRTAKHNVYAYVLNKDNYQKHSDDGEPGGTGGMPVLNIIQKNGLSDVVVVVTRYFGGILLGTGGLSRAYSEAAMLAVNNAQPSEMYLCVQASINIKYEYYKALLSLLISFGAIIENTDYTEDIVVTANIQKSQYDEFLEKASNISGGKAVINKLTEKYIAKN
jgi:uncharacterized YigZ family protein